MENAKLTAAIVFLTAGEKKDRLMLEPVCFAPPALWVAKSLMEEGVRRFLAVCRKEDADSVGACFPEATQVLTVDAPDAQEQLKTFLDETQGRVAVLTKPVLFFRQGAREMAQAQELPRRESAAGAYRAEARELMEALEDGGDLSKALKACGESLDGCVTALGSDYMARSAAEETARRLTAGWWLEQGVRMLNYDQVYIAPTVELEPGTVILPGTILRGDTHVGPGCELGPNTMLRDVTVGEGTTINSSQCNECTIGSHTTVGPFAYIRPNTHVGDHVKVGDFVELKNSVIGDATKISHLTYVGDSDVGERINFGCGTVTVNYDGAKKFRTVIGDGAFIGCNTNLVAPVSVGQGAYIAAGSTITRDVPSDSLAIARSQQTVKNQWAKKRRDKQQEKK